MYLFIKPWQLVEHQKIIELNKIPYTLLIVSYEKKTDQRKRPVLF